MRDFWVSWWRDSRLRDCWLLMSYFNEKYRQINMSKVSGAVIDMRTHRCSRQIFSDLSIRYSK